MMAGLGLKGYSHALSFSAFPKATVLRPYEAAKALQQLRWQSLLCLQLFTMLAFGPTQTLITVFQPLPRSLWHMDSHAFDAVGVHKNTYQGL